MRFCSFAPFVLLAMFSQTGMGCGVESQAQPTTTLEKLDAASARFTSAEAKVQREAYTAFIKETVTTQGSTYFIRDKGGKTQMGLATTGPGARTIEYKDGTVRDYNPAAGCYDSVTKPGIDTYLTLGFGGSGKDLARAWDVTDLGPDTIGGVKVEKLDLVPKDASVRQNINKVSLWVDLDRDVTYKQIFFSPNGDRNTATYSDIHMTKPSSFKAYEIKGKPCK